MSNRQEKSSYLNLIAEKEESLGLIDMENIRAFGEQSRNASNADRLKFERMKALETLQKSQRYDRKSSVSNKENEPRTPRTPASSHNQTDYYIPLKYNTINLSELVAEHTINFDLSEATMSATKNKISFEPSEITGRSTHFPPEKRSGSQLPSVEQILSSSCSANVRSMCDSLRESYGGEGISLPRTADMSRKNSLYSSNGFSFSNAPYADESGFSGEQFASYEAMKNRLQNDEISWAKEYADIPPTTDKDKTLVDKSICSPSADMSQMAANMANDPDFSMGSYFDKRSENLINIVKAKSPLKNRTPQALVDETLLGDTNQSITPKPDNKRYSRYATSVRASSILSTEKNSDSKDSGNATENSYVMSMSALDRAIEELNIGDSDSMCTKQLLRAKEVKSYPHPSAQNHSLKNDKFLSLDANFNRPLRTFQDSQDKENMNPKFTKHYKMSDTVSFTDSLLDSTDIKLANQSRTSEKGRIPLSPIDIKIVEPEDADTEDFERTPTVRRKKSPSPRKSPNNSDQFLSPNQRTKPKSPSKRSRSPISNPTLLMAPPGQPINQKGLSRKARSSTRLHDDNDSFPNCSKSVVSTRSPSPVCFESPSSSPRSYISSQVSSPRWKDNGPSPIMDITSNSDRRFLISGNASPDCGKMSLPTYGLPGRSSSTASLKSRCNSQCSNSSEFSHRDGKTIPIKVTCLELSWPSTKLRTNSKKTMQIKNTAMKRLVLKVVVSGPGFQIMNIEGNLLTLQSQECRTIDMCFCPTVIGAAVGRLSFSSPNGGSSAPFLEVPLFGYGGHASILPQNILKGPIGSPFISMGELYQLSSPLVQTFNIFNKGPLQGFAVIIVDSIGLDLPRLCECIEVTPKKVVIPPQSSVKIKITFKPKREDLRKIVRKISNVMTLASLRIVCGDEPTRQRLRQLIQKLSSNDRSKISGNSLDSVWNTLPQEKECADLKTLKERSEVSFDLVSTLRIHEVALTLNHSSMDETMQSTLVFPDADETIVFRTIIVNSPTRGLETVDEDETEGNTSEYWSVRPNIIKFNPFGRSNKASFTVTNFFKSTQNFSISCNFNHLFRFSPNKGSLMSNEQIEVTMTMDQHSSYLPNDIFIEVQMQNEKIRVQVKIANDDFSNNYR